MKILTTTSLAATVDAINEAFFFEKKIPRTDRAAAARWIVSRLGKAGS